MIIGLFEFLGGPLDGLRVPVPKGTESIVIRSSAATTCTYQMDEVHEGPKVRKVFRFMEGSK